MIGFAQDSRSLTPRHESVRTRAHLFPSDWNKKHAAKRGGKDTILSLDDEPAEDRYRREPSHHVTPENWHFRTGSSSSG
jgi:hypothetical protein